MKLYLVKYLKLNNNKKSMFKKLREFKKFKADEKGDEKERMMEHKQVIEKKVIDVIKNVVEKDNFLVCVSWIYQENGEEKLMHQEIHKHLSKEDMAICVNNYKKLIENYNKEQDKENEKEVEDLIYQRIEEK